MIIPAYTRPNASQMTEKIILASGSPFRKAMLVNAGIDVQGGSGRIDERALEARLQGSGATPEDVALVLAEAKALEVSETHARRAGARLRPDAVARRRGVPQAGRHGRRAPPSAGAVGQDASAEQRRRAGARRRDAVAACRHRQPDHAKARSGLHRPPSGARRRQGAVQRRRLPDRRRGHPAVREDRGRLFHHCRPAAAAVLEASCASSEPSMAEAVEEGLRLRPPDRAFALAEDPWLLAGEIRHRRQLRGDRRRAGRFCRSSSRRSAANGFAGGNVTIPHKEAAFAAGRAPRRGGRKIGAVNTLWFEDGVLVGRQHRRRWLCRQSRRACAGLGDERRGRRARRRRRGARGHPCAEAAWRRRHPHRQPHARARAGTGRSLRRRRFGAWLGGGGRTAWRCRPAGQHHRARHAWQ